MLELYVGIMTACMPAMKLFVSWVREEEAVHRESEEVTIGGGKKRKRKGVVMDSGHESVVIMGVESRGVLVVTGAVERGSMV